jgi:hypothetical protein
MIALDCNVLLFTLLGVLACGVVLWLRPVVGYGGGEGSGWVGAMMVGVVVGEGWGMVLGVGDGWVMVMGCGLVGVGVREIMKYRLKVVLMFSRVS